MSCGDGSGHQLDTGFGAGWSNNLNEGTVQNHNLSLGQQRKLWYKMRLIWLKTAQRKTFGKNAGYLYGS